MQCWKGKVTRVSGFHEDIAADHLVFENLSKTIALGCSPVKRIVLYLRDRYC